MTIGKGKIFLIGAFLVGGGLIACNPSFKTSIKSKTLNFTLDKNDKENYKYNITYKESDKPLLMPDSINKITIKDIELSNTKYIYNKEDKTLLIPNNVINGDIVITAEALHQYEASIKSTSIELSNKVVIENNDYDTKLIIKDISNKSILPSSLSSVMVNGIELSREEYTYSQETGELHIDKNKIKGDIVVTVEALQKYNASIVSSSLNISNKIAVENSDYDTVISIKEKTESTFLPGELNFITVNGQTLNKEEYTYDDKTGNVHIDKSKVLGDIVICAEKDDIKNYAYQVKFKCDEHCRVYLYKTQDYTQDPELTNFGYSRDGNTGEYKKDGSGQVNFKVEVDDGYDIDYVWPQGLYKNCKGKDDTGVDDTYRITKINSDLKVVVSTIKTQVKSLTCVGDYNNKTFKFTWSLRKEELVDHVEVIVDHNGIQESYDVTYNEIELNNIVYDEGYVVSFTPVFKDQTKGYKRIVNKMLHDFSEKNTFPKLDINTKNNKLPTFNKVNDKAKTKLGLHEGEDAYIQSDISLYDSENNLRYESGDKSKFKNCKIKVRGNGSSVAKGDKKPLKIKLSKSADILDYFRTNKVAEVDYKNKEWVLLPYNDKFSDLSGFTLNRTLNFDYSHEWIYLTVYLNGDYLGLYTLVEDNNEGEGTGNKQSRYKVDNTGFILENSYTYVNDDAKFNTDICKSIFGYSFKYPSSEDINNKRIQEVKKELCNIETLLINNDSKVFDYIDIDSFAKWLFYYDLIGQQDTIGANKFLYKESKDRIIKFGTPWDFEYIYGIPFPQQGSGLKSHNEFYFKYLLLYSQFKSKLLEELNKYKTNIESDVDKAIKKINKEKFNNTLLLEKNKYNITYTNYDDSYNFVINYFKGKLKNIEYISD